jgi:hypothetical protein
MAIASQKSWIKHGGDAHTYDKDMLRTMLSGAGGN